MRVFFTRKDVLKVWTKDKVWIHTSTALKPEIDTRPQEIEEFMEWWLEKNTPSIIWHSDLTYERFERKDVEKVDCRVKRHLNIRLT